MARRGTRFRCQKSLEPLSCEWRLRWATGWGPCPVLEGEPQGQARRSRRRFFLSQSASAPAEAVFGKRLVCVAADQRATSNHAIRWDFSNVFFLRCLSSSFWLERRTFRSIHDQGTTIFMRSSLTQEVFRCIHRSATFFLATNTGTRGVGDRCCRAEIWSQRSGCLALSAATR